METLFVLRNPYTLKKAISMNPKLYDASHLHSSNVRVNVCDTKEIIKDATKSQLKMKEKLEDPIAIEKKVNFVPVNYGKLNDIYETFVPQVDPLEQKYFSKASMSNGTPVNTNANLEGSVLRNFCYNEVEPILDYLYAIFKVIQKEFPEDVQVMMNVFESMESVLNETLKQNALLNDKLLKATLTHDVEKCVLMQSEYKNDDLDVEIEKIKSESKDIQENLLKRIKILEHDFQRCQAQNIDFQLQLQHQKEKTDCEQSLKNLCETSWIS
ncbi:hypothetical protein Tco_0475592 [Tanacetum coccineum]